jgi:hypothetical protein
MHSSTRDRLRLPLASTSTYKAACLAMLSSGRVNAGVHHVVIRRLVFIAGAFILSL